MYEVSMVSVENKTDFYFLLFFFLQKQSQAADIFITAMTRGDLLQQFQRYILHFIHVFFFFFLLDIYLKNL